jgi:hypothetical protein
VNGAKGNDERRRSWRDAAVHLSIGKHRLDIKLVPVLGFSLVVLIIRNVIVFTDHTPTPFQIVVFRMVFALATAGVVASIDYIGAVKGIGLRIIGTNDAMRIIRIVMSVSGAVLGFIVAYVYFPSLPLIR